MGRLPQDRRCHRCCEPFPADGVMFMTHIEPPRFRKSRPPRGDNATARRTNRTRRRQSERRDRPLYVVVRSNERAQLARCQQTSRRRTRPPQSPRIRAQASRAPANVAAGRIAPYRHYIARAVERGASTLGPSGIVSRRGSRLRFDQSLPTAALNAASRKAHAGPRWQSPPQLAGTNGSVAGVRLISG
jgi:hypothetical protein